MLNKLEAIKERFEYVSGQMTDPEVIMDTNRYMKVGKEYKSLKVIVDAYEEYKTLLSNISSAEEMLKGETDAEMIEMAKMELEELQPKKIQLEDEIQVLLIPKDPEDEKNAIMEIRSGTGGDEASIFAGDLYKMYTYYFNEKKFKVDAVTVNEGTVGGYNKIILEITGDNVYGHLKYESGAHRVQRVPKTESQGRVHTSAATVAVMPVFEMEDVEINKADLSWDTFRASGAGGQHVNKTESAVRVTHAPTGIVVECQDGRSQLKNRDIALQRLYVKIHDKKREEHDAGIANRRRSLVASGDRSAKIRTYNYPQNRVTDHRINLTLYSLGDLMTGKEGKLQDIIDKLTVEENAEKLKEGAN